LLDFPGFAGRIFAEYVVRLIRFPKGGIVVSKEISPGREFAYYLGGILTVIGILMFSSPFLCVGIGLLFRNEKTFEPFLFSFGAAFIGFFIIAIGQMIRQVGEKGMSGSGVILNPEQAREDLEPYSRMAGGMLRDALDEADIHPKTDRVEKVIMLKCPACGHLNDEDANFCQKCGTKL
jgi:hypothetical protein